MSSEPGLLIGEGRTAQVYEFGVGQAIKLLLPGRDVAALRDEALKTAAAVAAGAPAPLVHGIEDVAGRPGIVFDRVTGNLMLDLIIASPWRAGHWGRRLAEVHFDVMSCHTEQLPDIRDFLAAKIAHVESLRPGEKARATDVLSALPPGNSVLHGDFHAMNVYLGDEPIVIDWLDSARGVPEADLARSFWLTSHHVIPPDFPRRWAVVWVARALGRAYRRTALELLGLGQEAVDAWKVPVLAARLSEGIDYEEELLVREVRRRLG